MSQSLSQSQKAIQRIIFKLYERWGDIENKHKLIISLIESPQESSKEERQLISALIAIKNNSEEFESNLQLISNLFEQYIDKKIEMLDELAAGKVLKADEIKNKLIQQNNSIKDEINTAYENIFTSSAVKAKEHINQLISSKKFKLAQDFLNSSEFLVPQNEYYKNKIDHLSINFEKQQQILDLLERELTDEILKDQMLALWKKLDLPSTDMQYLISKVSAKVIELIDNKKLYQAEKIIKDILIHLQLFPEALHVSLLTKKESSFN